MCDSYEISNAEEIRDFLTHKFGVNGTRIFVRIVHVFANPTNKNLTFQGNNILRARISKKIRVCAYILGGCKVHIYRIDTNHSTDQCP